MRWPLITFFQCTHSCTCVLTEFPARCAGIRHFSLLNVNVAGACGYDFRCDGGRLVRAYLRR